MRNEDNVKAKNKIVKLLRSDCQRNYDSSLHEAP